jgi:hypothetical protein
MRRLFPVLLGLLVLGLGSDLPAHRADKPLHAQLLFGKEGRLRVWAVMEGKALRLERDGDPKTQVGNFASVVDCKDVKLDDPDGKTHYVINRVSDHEEKKPTPRRSLMFNVTIEGPVTCRQYCDVELSERQEGAAVAHFHGPLTAQPVTILWKIPPGLALDPEGETDVRMLVGTLDAKSRCWTVVYSHNGEKSAFAEGVHPRLEVEWPTGKAGEKPLREEVSLKESC